ncbi:hypothetical protein [Lewinella sp. 4G2]|uniref:hypothetical protein n=1 Tax=Lewinella sp. 4G2 TaxID=1803372 RepID=UPI0007B4BF56|nr:hypothetical protein [Lewinella sp. 4G2]OAV44773.1 hypothetical protein A3850_009850 [Lewinella sp. 4G2]
MRFQLFLGLLLVGLPLGAQLPPELVLDINPGRSSSLAEERGVVLNGRLIFPASNDATGTEIWISDGTPAGTRLLSDIVPGEDGSEPHGFTKVGDQVFFAATTPRFGTELYRTDGTTRGTRIVADIFTGPASGLLEDPDRTFGFAQDTLLFAARNSIAETELWRSDGTLEGTYLLKDIEVLGNNTRGSLPRDFHTGDNVTYFTAESGIDNRQIWRTDGTEDGTVRVSNFRGANGITLESMVVHKDTAYFGALTRLTSYDLYKLGPDNARPTLIFDFNGPGMNIETDSDDDRYAFIGDRFIFAADINGGADVYVSDGSPQGTRIIENLPEIGNGGYAPQHFTTVGDFVYYADATPTGGVELWRTNGSQLGTTQVKDLIPGAESGIVPSSLFHEHEGQLYFAARGLDNNGNSTGTELYVSDGTVAGTVLVSNVNRGGGSSFPTHFLSVDKLLYFFADDGEIGHELYSLRTQRPLVATIVALTPVSCFGGNDGTATFNVSGGSTEAEGTAGEQSVTNLTVGEKAIFFRDMSGNAVRVTFTITGPDSDFTVTSATTPARLRDGGTITLTVEGATPPYRYAWSDTTLTDSIRTDLNFGEYTVTITDANDCTYEETFVIDDLTAVSTFAQAGIKLYPNPVKDQLTVDLDTRRVASAEIFTLAGRKVTTIKEPASDRLVISLTGHQYRPGPYAIVLRMTDGRVMSSRFVIR